MPRQIQAGDASLAFPDDTPDHAITAALRDHLGAAGGVDPAMHLQMAGVGATQAVAEHTARQADQQAQIGMALLQRLDALTMAMNRLADVMGAPKQFAFGADGKVSGLGPAMVRPPGAPPAA